MSWENLKDAYRTRLGNLPAKSVLVLMVDEANAAGLAILSIDRVVALTEINRRTVLRIIQVFAEMDLAHRAEGFIDGKSRPAFQVNLAKLGMDLRESFSVAYRAASSKCLRDAPESVSETRAGVSETRKGVSETVPPDPHKGVPLLSPLPPRADDVAPKEPDPPGFSPEQQAHIDELRAANRRADAAMWEGWYTEQNEAAAKACAEEAERERNEAARLDRMKAEMPTVASARAWMMRECGFVPSRRARELEGALEAVLNLEVGCGAALWEVAPKMAQAWQRYQANGALMSIHYGPVKFFELGIWRDERGWPWDQAALRDRRMRAEAGRGGR